MTTRRHRNLDLYVVNWIHKPRPRRPLPELWANLRQTSDEIRILGVLVITVVICWLAVQIRMVGI